MDRIYRRAPWVSGPLNVEVEFKADGTYTSKSLSTYFGNQNLLQGNVAFYYGSNDEINSYLIFDVNADGSARGEIGRFNDQTNSSLRFVKFSNELNVLSFEFWHRNQYGPLEFALTRVE